MSPFLWRNPAFNAWEDVTAEDFPRNAEIYFLRVRDFYDVRAKWHRRFYRFAGLLVIVLGGSLPLVASATFPFEDVVLGAIGFIVATVTALRGFYRWDTSWVILRRTEIDLSRQYLEWKSSQVALSDATSQRREANKLLQQLLVVRAKESEAFFKELPQPTLEGKLPSTWSGSS